MGFTNYNDVKNVNKTIALREFDDTKAEFKEYVYLVSELFAFIFIV